MTLLGMESFDIQTLPDLLAYGKYRSGSGYWGVENHSSLQTGRVAGLCLRADQGWIPGFGNPRYGFYMDADVGSLNPADLVPGQPVLFTGFAFMDVAHTDQGGGSPHWMAWLDTNMNTIMTLHEDANNYMYLYTSQAGVIAQFSKPLFPNRWHYIEIGVKVSPNTGWVECRLDSQVVARYYGLLTPPTTPVLTAGASGGTWTAGTAWVKTTYVNAQGESIGSVTSSVAVVNSGTLTITSPPAAGLGTGVATGWYAYVGKGSSEPTDTNKYRQQLPGVPTPIGTSLVITANPTIVGNVVPLTNTAGAATSRAGALGNTLGNALGGRGVRWLRVGNSLSVSDAGIGMYGRYDDWVWLNDQGTMNNDFLGDLRVVGMLPIAAGSHSDFVVGGTAPYGGVANPVAVPGLATAATGGTVLAGAYLVAYSWTNANGETVISATASITTTGTISTITVTPPAFVTGATGYHVYISQAGGGPLTRQTALPQTASPFVLTAPPSSGGAAPPANNTTPPNWQNVNKSPVPGDVAFVQSNVLNAKDSYRMAPLPTGTISVYGILPQAIAKKSDAGARSVSALFRVPVIPNPIPPPVLTIAGAGGTILAGTYCVGYAYSNSNGETLLSTTALITTVGTTSTISVTVPALPTGATAWAVYFAPINTTSPLYRQANGLTALTYMLSAPPTTVGPQPQAANQTGTDTNVGQGTSLQNTYGLLTGLVETKPDLTPWTPTDVNNLEVGATITL